MLESDYSFQELDDIRKFKGINRRQHLDSYYWPLYNAIKNREKTVSIARAVQTTLYGQPILDKESEKKYVFIIDEINRGEISKILGELFFAIDPGYRGKKGEVSTQYAALHDDEDEKFYVPENLYIIGTMNDIDRSVDTFDFAMRRRFRFIEIKADTRLDMLASLSTEIRNEAEKRMKNLNAEIIKAEGLNENYQIGPAYFLKLNDNDTESEFDFDTLWTDCLLPLLQDYVQGMPDEDDVLKRFADAYGYEKTDDTSV